MKKSFRIAVGAVAFSLLGGVLAPSAQAFGEFDDTTEVLLPSFTAPRNIPAPPRPAPEGYYWSWEADIQCTDGIVTPDGGIFRECFTVGMHWKLRKK